MSELFEKSTPIPAEAYVRVEYTSLEDFIAEVFTSFDVSKDSATIIAEALVMADLMGVESHGVQRLSRYLGGIRIGSVNTKPKLKILSESPSTALIDGDSGCGHPIAYKAMQIAVDKAEKTGASVVGIRNSHHFGMAGYYVFRAIENDKIGVVMTNSEPLVAYTHAKGRSVGTNPIAIGCPTKKPPPILFDAAMATVPIGKIEVYAKEGKDIPLGWAMERSGELLKDPNEVLAKKGAVLPLGGLGEKMGGHKGAGLALIVDLLCGVLTGAGWGRNVKHTLDKEHGTVGHFMIAIDVKSLMPLELFLENVTKFKNYVKSLPRISQNKPVWIPGEKAHLTMKTRKRIGIPIHKKILEDLKEEGRKAGIEFNVEMLKETA